MVILGRKEQLTGVGRDRRLERTIANVKNRVGRDRRLECRKE